MSKRAIPCLDFQKFKGGNAEQRAEFSKEIRHAFEEYGFANIGGHDVSEALIENTYRTMADFFALAEETKMKYSIAGIGGQIGYTPFGVEHAAERPQPDLKEFWHFTQTHMNNPDVPEVEDFAPTGRALYSALEEVGTELLQAVAMGLELGEHYFDEKVAGGHSVLRPIHYPPITAEPDGSIRAGEHEDINLITLLVGSSAGGLEVLDADGKWLAVGAHTEHITVNVGDMLQNLTGGLLKSTTHRVVLPERSLWHTPRYSVPFFLHPIGEMPLAPIMGSQSYRDWTAQEYLDHRLKEIGLT
jgi:isopenicillin N synthase-like dioxygenase